MKIYLVGGAVRDLLMNKTPQDRDFVIVGATKEDIKNLEESIFSKIDKEGNKKVLFVGKDFPVYLHKETNEEYALARKEKKIGKGYHGFSFEFDETVSLEDDLIRRDLTINSIAYDEESKTFIDPYGGIQDIKNKILRPTSVAFKEDPVRVLRCARFASKLNFSLSEEIISLSKEVVSSGELETIHPNRIKNELEKVFKESQNKELFFSALKELGALDSIFPSISNYEEMIKSIKNFTGDWDSFTFILYFYCGESIHKICDSSKKIRKEFKLLKENYELFYRRINSFTNDEFLKTLSTFSFTKKEIQTTMAEKLIKETFNLLFGERETNLSVMISISNELKILDFSEYAELHNKREIINNIKMNKLIELREEYENN